MEANLPRARRRIKTKPNVVRRDTIYFIKCETSGLIKIGFTTRTPEARLRESQTFAATSLRILTETPGTLEQEKQLHKIFAATNHHGEWFDTSPELEDLIDSLIEASDGTSGIYSSSTSPEHSFLAEWIAGSIHLSVE